MTIHIEDILRHKRDRLPLTSAEIEFFVHSVTARTISDAQTSALLMAIFLNGLEPEELAALTQAMRFSGETFDASPLATFTVDKHSTGGVGDKTSILLAPILAAAGLASPTPAGVPGICVPMISGRSLGHTGGTLDKLETIPGFDTQLSLARFAEVLGECGAAMIGQTPTLVPADRILYGLRDHTSTVESPYLITASIMSKKLAESLNGLVLDVKTGSGAFMRSEDGARHLAQLMVETGEAAGTRTVALLTDMSQPLGRFAGNWCEIRECVDILQGRRHPLSADLITLTNILAGWMLHLAGHAPTPDAGAEMSDQLLRGGSAYSAFLKIVAAQGGDTAIFSDPERLHPPAHTRVVEARTTGYLGSMDCTEVGWAVQRLGAGRLHPGDPVSAAAGLEMHVKLGEYIHSGQPLCTLFADDPTLLDEPEAMLRRTLCITDKAPASARLVRETIVAKNRLPQAAVASLLAGTATVLRAEAFLSAGKIATAGAEASFAPGVAVAADPEALLLAGKITAGDVAAPKTGAAAPEADTSEEVGARPRLEEATFDNSCGQVSETYRSPFTWLEVRPSELAICPGPSPSECRFLTCCVIDNFTVSVCVTGADTCLGAVTPGVFDWVPVPVDGCRSFNEMPESAVNICEPPSIPPVHRRSFQQL